MPSREYHFWVYILSSRSRNLYIGMTNNLSCRMAAHREKVPGPTLVITPFTVSCISNIFAMCGVLLHARSN